jgi:hypothetical protein
MAQRSMIEMAGTSLDKPGHDQAETASSFAPVKDWL